MGDTHVTADDDDQPTERRRMRRREAAIIVAFWTFLAILITAGRLTDPRLADRPLVPRSGPILITLFEAYLWAALTPLIFRLAARFNLARRRWLWQVPLLLAIGVGLALLVSVGTTLLRNELLDLPHRGRPGLASRLDRFVFLNDFIIYLGVLAAGFARENFRRYEARNQEAAALRAQLAEAQLATLRMQLNPHFLFNTLHAISALVERDPVGVRRMIARLSELLRTTLEESAESERTVDRELAFLSRYLEIMQVRFQGRLQVEMDVDPAARDALVPTLILQPLVENAGKHGISSARRGGRIVISARRHGDRVRLAVRDTGPGPAPADRPPFDRGLGLRNTEARLRQLYGEAQPLTLRPAEGGGAIAELELPYRPASAGAESAVAAAGAGAAGE
ncbi:MAG TPA: histidine kinase [Vicinamibacteria bacterium]|nr:histidine kinase [Vicinamibacteria bacterium]